MCAPQHFNIPRTPAATHFFFSLPHTVSALSYPELMRDIADFGEQAAGQKPNIDASALEFQLIIFIANTVAILVEWDKGILLF